MFGSEILEVAVGLIFIYLLLSLICSAVNEIIETFLKRRAANLEKGIRELLQDPDGKGLAGKLYTHPLIFGLFQGDYDPERSKEGFLKKSNLPSYIPSRNFALALLDIILPAQETPSDGSAAGPKSLQPLREAIAKIQNLPVQRALLTLVEAAGNDIDKARKNIEAWYDSAMDRVSGWYKRQVQRLILIFSLLLAIAVNADTIMLAKSLSSDETVSNAVIAAIDDFDKTPVEAPQQAADPQQRVKEIQGILKELQGIGLPMGWDRSDERMVPNTFPGWLSKALGWLLTAIAISLGAPFWFDVLNRVMVIRSTVKPREKSPEEPPVDRR